MVLERSWWLRFSLGLRPSLFREREKEATGRMQHSTNMNHNEQSIERLLPLLKSKLRRVPSLTAFSGLCLVEAATVGSFRHFRRLYMHAFGWGRGCELWGASGGWESQSFRKTGIGAVLKKNILYAMIVIAHTHTLVVTVSVYVVMIVRFQSVSGRLEAML